MVRPSQGIYLGWLQPPGKEGSGGLSVLLSLKKWGRGFVKVYNVNNGGSVYIEKGAAS